MVNTKLQKQIEKTFIVPTNDNLTMRAKKQIELDKVFKANIYGTYQPQPTDSKFDLLVGYKVHISITRHCLKNLASKGNINAMELLNNINHTISTEDLQQEVLVWFVDNESKWNIDFDGKVTFEDDSIVRDLFGIVSTNLYQFQTKHYKHLYIEIDGDIVDVTRVSQLADYTSIDRLLENVVLNDFINNLKGNEKEWLLLRLEGLSNYKIADVLGVTRDKVRGYERTIRRQWNSKKVK